MVASSHKKDLATICLITRAGERDAGGGTTPRIDILMRQGLKCRYIAWHQRAMDSQVGLGSWVTKGPQKPIKGTEAAAVQRKHTIGRQEA